MRIQHNILAMNAYRNYNANTSALAKNLEKLSSGYRINRAGDDAAGLAISEKMRAQITGLNAAQKNVKDGISLVKTAEGATQEIQDMLNRMKYLATQSANGTYQDEVDRDNIQKEVDALRTEINRIADSSNFNGINLLDGKLGLNDDAFTVLGAAQAQTGADKTSTIITNWPGVGHSSSTAGTTGTATILHKEGTTAQAGEVIIDVSGLSATSSNTSAAQVKITINGKDYNLTATAATGVGGTTTALDGKGIATLLTAAINADNSSKGFIVNDAGTSSNTGTTAAAGLIYKATDRGDGTVKLVATYDGAGTALVGGVPSKATSDNALKVNWDVKADQGVNTTNLTIDANNNVGSTAIKSSIKPSDVAFANTAVDFNTTQLKDGMVLEIAGEKYTFAVGKNSSITGTGVIDLKDLDVTDANNKTEIMNRITQATKGNATFTVGHNSAGKLTLAEKNNGQGATSVTDPDILKALGDVAGFKSLLKISEADSKAGTQVKITDANVKEGDTLSIDGKTYVFSDKNTPGASGDVTYVAIAGGAAQNLATTLGATNASLNGDTLTVFTQANKAAPSILGKGLVLQIGDTAQDFNQLGVKIGDMHTTAMNSATGMSIEDIKVNTQTDAAAAVEVIKDAINYVSSIRGDLGATQNRLEHTANNLSVMAENIQDAESTIRDTDVAEEMMAYTKNNILVQAAQAMLAQANAVPQGVLQLLQ